MILNSLLSLQLRPMLSSWAKHSRNIRPNIKVAKDKFQLQLDVRNFNKDEIRVKARPEYVIVEGKQEKKTKTGLIMRQFTRKFKLPSRCNLQCMQSKLSPDGILTITAPRKFCEENLPCETLIPVSTDLPQADDRMDVSFVPVQEEPKAPKTVAKDPCQTTFSKSAEKIEKPDESTKKPPSGGKI